MCRVCDYEHNVGPVVLDPSMVVRSNLYFGTSQPHTMSPAYAAMYEVKSHLMMRMMEIHLGRELMIQVIKSNRIELKCNLVITLILEAKRNEHYNKTSVIMKCTFQKA